jgi:hypothetical protein
VIYATYLITIAPCLIDKEERERRKRGRGRKREREREGERERERERGRKREIRFYIAKSIYRKVNSGGNHTNYAIPCLDYCHLLSYIRMTIVS